MRYTLFFQNRKFGLVPAAAFFFAPQLPVEHRPSTKALHSPLSCAIFSRSHHDFFAAFISASTSLLHVILGLPLALLPWGFHNSPWRVKLSRGLRNVCPIHLHFLFLSSISIGCCPVLSRSCLLLIVSGQWMPTMRRKHLLQKTCNFCTVVLLALQDSEP